jgi:metal-responsive CopG/Arc/MetJ family transcriptional regulator
VGIKRITVSLDEETAAELDRYAREHHWSRSVAAALLIEAALKQQRGESR